MPGAPDLIAVTDSLRERDVKFVVIGGMAVIAHNVVRTTDDTDILIPDDHPANDEAVLRALEDLGCIAWTALG